MKKIKLSPAQVKVLRALAELGAVARWSPNYFIIHPANHIRTLTMRRLIALDFVGFTHKNGHWETAYILPAGRDYLRTLEGE